MIVSFDVVLVCCVVGRFPACENECVHLSCLSGSSIPHRDACRGGVAAGAVETREPHARRRGRRCPDGGAAVPARAARPRNAPRQQASARLPARRFGGARRLNFSSGYRLISWAQSVSCCQVLISVHQATSAVHLVKLCTQLLQLILIRHGKTTSRER